MKDNGWQRWALGVTVAFLLGGGGSAIYGNAQAAAVETRLKAEISELKQEVRDSEAWQEKEFDIIISMAAGLARVEVQLEEIQRRLNES